MLRLKMTRARFAAGVVAATALALMLTGVHSASTWDLVPGLLLAGAGVGIVLGQLIQFILAAVSMNEVGSASGVMEASQQLSTSLGVAVLGTIFFALFKHHPATDGWILDERGRIRRHINVFVNGERGGEETPVAGADHVDVLPAISGGG